MQHGQDAKITGAAPVKAWWDNTWLGAGVIVALTMAVYWHAFTGGFIWDDNIMVSDNPFNRMRDGWWQLWSAPPSDKSPDYFPLTYMMFWVQYQLWGNNAAGYHTVNIVLHIVDCLLLWRVLKELKLPAAWLVAAIFAIHPVNVPSVAWVAELKNTMVMLFFLGTIFAYLKFEDESGGTGHRRILWYLAAIGLFVLGCLSKSTIVVLPPVLLLLAWWRKNKVTADNVFHSLPFWGLSLVCGLLTMWYQYRGNGGMPATMEFLPIGLYLVGKSVWFYIAHDFWPVNNCTVLPVNWNPMNGAKLDFRSVFLLPYAPTMVTAVAAALLLLLTWFRRQSWLAWAALLACACFLIGARLEVNSRVIDLPVEITVVLGGTLLVLAFLAIASVWKPTMAWARLGFVSYGYVMVGLLVLLSWFDQPAIADSAPGFSGAPPAYLPTLAAVVTGLLLLALALLAARRQTARWAKPALLSLGGILVAAKIILCWVPMACLPTLMVVVVLLLLALFAWWKRTAAWGRALFFAYAYFLITMSLMLGIFPTLYLQFSPVADHWQYLSVIAWIALPVCGITRLVESWTLVDEGAKAKKYGMAPLLLMGGIILGVLLDIVLNMFCEVVPVIAFRLLPGKDSPPLFHSDIISLLLLAGGVAGLFHAYALGGAGWKRQARARSTEMPSAVRWPLVPGAAVLAAFVLIALSAIAYNYAWVYSKSTRVWLDVINRNPTAWVAYNNYGRDIAEGRLGWVTAMPYFKKAVELNTTYADALHNLGTGYYLTGNLVKSAEVYQRALQVKNRPESWTQLGMVCRKQKKLAEALNCFEQALHLDEGYLTARFQLASLQEDAGNVPDAVINYGLFLQYMPNDAMACNNLAWILTTTPNPAIRDPRKALELAKRAAILTAAAGGEPRVLDTLAAAYAACGQFPQAVEAGRAAIARAQAIKFPPQFIALIEARVKLYQSGSTYLAPANAGQGTLR